MAAPTTLRAARPMVWMSEPEERRKPSLSASRMATSETSGRSSPSRSRLMPTRTFRTVTRASLEEQMQPQLHDAVRDRGPRDPSEVRVERIRDRLGELRVIQRVEQVRPELEPPRLAARQPEVLLDGQVQVIRPWIPDVREVPRRVAERLRRIAGTRRPYQAWRRARAGEVERVAVEPGGGCLLEPV